MLLEKQEKLEKKLYRSVMNAHRLCGNFPIGSNYMG